MGGVDEVLARLDEDARFGALLERDPRAALADYDLSSDDLAALARRIDGRGRPAPGLSEGSAFRALFSHMEDEAD